MAELLKRSFELFVKNRWLKIIDKECDKYNKIKRKLSSQQYVVNSLLAEYKKIYGEDLRTPKERGADKPKVTCLNCKHFMFSDMYGECNKQLRIVNPSDTCEYLEPKERGE